MPGGWYVTWKGKVEWLIALVLFLLAAPLILLTALLVKLTSRGPAFYFQTRLGKNGKPYTIYKIRTMYHNAESATGPRWATAHDPRVTPLGWFLRHTHLDELPQLWNVLRGDMALVGPRPERPEFVLKLAPLVPNYHDRLLVLPGVTGLAQVSLPADTNLESVRKKLAHDLYYLQRISLWLDVRIVMTTALDLIGMPFRISRKLFPIPDSDLIEKEYECRVAQEQELQRENRSA